MFKDLLEKNTKEEIRRITLFLKETFAKQNIKNAVIGLSGGIDSAVSLALLSKALPLENIFVYHLPYFDKIDQDAEKLLEKINLPKSQFKMISIKTMVDNLITELKVSEDDFIRRGNIMARVRMITLFDLAKKQQAMVVGTENRSEHFLGYFTRFGDAASDIEPMAHLYKTQVYKLAQELGIPKAIIEKTPSANLWSDQADEAEFGFTYQEADPILHLYFDKKNSAFSIERMYPGAEKIIEFAEKNSFKQNVPYSL